MAQDRDAERAVERWIRLSDEVITGKVGGQRDDTSVRSCVGCGTTFNILGGDERALCARCFLEPGTTRTIG
jgi:hypothetical protein